MIQRERLAKDFESMSHFTASGEGINRLAFTDADWEGRQYIINRMNDAGLDVEIDGFGNVIGYKVGTNPDLPVVMVGSHTDSVPNGGNYDGVAGVLSAIEVVRSIIDDGFEHEQKKIGIVSGIAAPERFYVTIRGNADHSGATPMNLRHDALCGASKIILGIEEVTSMQEEPPVVGTVGIAEVVPGAMNVIPGSVKLGVDIRSISKVARDSVVFLIKELIDVIAEKRGLSYTIEPIAQDHPVAMHPVMIREIEEAVKSVGVDYMTMPSGAGHDAMHWTEVAPTGMIFIPCRDGISHNPAEFAAMDDIVAGSEVLENVIKNISLVSNTLD